ncbi:hypothetical protein HDV01_006860 [Terramyces sp. JEL0728]|nr:hypothetical protein HDV01_006860 [Terramyces sp. JEL0728]
MDVDLDTAIKTHRKNKPFKKRKHHNNPWSEPRTANVDGQWVVSITNLHWNVSVSKEDLIELFGGKEAVSSVSIKFDESGRSLGNAEVVVKSKGLAEAAKANLDGQTLDGLVISVNLVREFKKKSDITNRLGPNTGGGILDRLGKRVEDRLGKRVEDRLGKRVEERLGKKVQQKKKKNDAMDTDPPARQIKSYADTEMAVNDGTLV